MVLDPPREKVNVTLMIVFSFIPVLGIYAAWRIQKFWMLLLIEIGISFVFGIVIIPLAFFLPDLSIFIGLAVGIGVNVILVKYFAEKYNEKIDPTVAKSQKITNYIQSNNTPVKISQASHNANNLKNYLKDFFPKKGLIIGAICVSAIMLLGHLGSTNVFVMNGDGMYPVIKSGDLIYFNEIPFSQVAVDDLILYQDSGLVYVKQVIQDGVVEIIVKNTNDQRSFVGSSEYIGKVTSITPDWGHKIILNPPVFLSILVASFIIPNLAMWIRK